jgi:phosphoribosylglycinamide formyltransferase-1
MRILSASFATRWRGRILNIHPSLLPAFRGLDTHRRALEAGEKTHGCSVHFVEPELDAGPIVGQRRVAVREDDTPETLAARVLEKEHELYPQALAAVASGRVSIEGPPIEI